VEQWPDSPQVSKALEAMLAMKAAVPAGTTTDATSYAPLVHYGLAAEFINLLQSVSLFFRLPSGASRFAYSSLESSELVPAHRGEKKRYRRQSRQRVSIS
jgi:hypothetical protein